MLAHFCAMATTKLESAIAYSADRVRSSTKDARSLLCDAYSERIAQIVQGELKYMMENSAQREINLVRLAEFQRRYSDLSSYRGYSYHLRSTQSHFDETIWSQRENQAKKN